MRVRWLLPLALLAVLAIACKSDPLRRYQREPAADFLFRQQHYHFQCGYSRWPGKPLPPGGVLEGFPQAPYAYSQPITLALPRGSLLRHEARKG